MQTLTTVNRCLATLGEKALASLEEPHAFKGDALTYLSEENKACQARGWWYNLENLTLNPMLNGKIVLPGDIIELRTGDASLVQRGQYLYDTVNGTDVFTKSYDVVVVRLVPFESLPESAAEYISWSTVQKFQMQFDGDTTRAAQIDTFVTQARVWVNTNDTRNKKVNMIAANPRLVMLQARNRQIRRW